MVFTLAGRGRGRGRGQAPYMPVGEADAAHSLHVSPAVRHVTGIAAYDECRWFRVRRAAVC